MKHIIKGHCVPNARQSNLRMVIGLTFLMLLVVEFSSFINPPDTASLEIHVTKISRDKIQGDFLYHFSITKSEPGDVSSCMLPFLFDPKNPPRLFTNDVQVFTINEFNPGRCILNIKGLKKGKIDFDMEFPNVEIPAKLNENELSAILDFGFNPLPEKFRKNRLVSLYSFQLSNVELKNSSPKFKLIETNKYQISSPTSMGNAYFVMPMRKQADMRTFWIFSIAMVTSFFGSIMILKSKRQAIISCIAGVVIVLCSGVLLYLEFLPGEFIKEIDMIDSLGGFIGLGLALVCSSLYKLRSMNARVGAHRTGPSAG